MPAKPDSSPESCPKERLVGHLRENGGKVAYDLAVLGNFFNEGTLFVLTIISDLHELDRIHLAGDHIHLNPEN